MEPGNPTLILLPGLHGTGRLFAPFTRALPQSMPHQVVDYPTDQPLGYDALLSFVQSAFPAHGQFVLVAESFSGPLAVMAAAENPKGLIAIVLCASFVRSPTLMPVRLKDLLVPECFIRWMPKFLLNTVLLGRDGDAPLRLALLDAVKANRPNVIAHRIHEVLHVDVRDHLRRCSIPMLYIRAARDRLVGKRSVDDFLAVRPELVVKVLPSPHLVLQTQSDAAVKAIVQFLAVD